VGVPYKYKYYIYVNIVLHLREQINDVRFSGSLLRLFPGHRPRYKICVCDASASIQRSQDGSTNITTGPASESMVERWNCDRRLLGNMVT